jgi:hypothetical protein
MVESWLKASKKLSIFVKSSRVKSKMPLYGREPSGSKEAV